MTAPSGGGGRGRGRSRSGARQTPLYEEMRDVVTQMKTAADMLAQASASTESLAKSADKAFKDTTATLQMLMAQMQAQGGGQFGPVIGGTQTPGWGFNRVQPILPGYHGPGAVPSGGGYGYGYGGPAYPGPGNPGFGSGQGPGGTPFGYQPDPYARRGTPMGRAQRAVGRYLNNNFGLSQGGTVAGYTDIGGGRYAMHGPDGSMMTDPATGTVRSISRDQMALRTGVTQVAGGLAEGEGIMGALTRLPGVGTAISLGEGVYKFGQFVGDQRAANAQYQSIYGPGTSGFDQRLHEYGGRFRNWASNLGSAFGIGNGGLSDSDYDQTFKGVSAMGYQGADRNNMIRFATNNFNSMGMGVNESLQLLDANSKQTSTSLSELSDQLQSVSKMAQTAGQSADVFRQKYISTYTQNVAQGLGGGSGALAMANTAISAGMGRPFTGYSASSMYGNVGGQQFLASAAGYSNVTSFMLAAQENPTVMAGAMDTQIDRIMDQAASPEAKKYCQELIDRNGGRQAIVNDQTGGAAGRILQEVLNRYNEPNVYSIATGLASIQFSGVDLSNNVAVGEYWVKWVATKGNMLTKQTTTAMQQYQRKSVDPKKDGGNAWDALSAAAGGGMLQTKHGVVNDQLIAKLTGDHVGNVMVQTKDGQQMVTLDEAIKDYRGQVLNGSAILADGPQAGTSIVDAYGREYGVKAPMGTNITNKGVFDERTQKYISSLGLTTQQQAQLASTADFFGNKRDKGFDAALMGAANKMAESNKSGGGGTVTLDLTPAARALVQPSVTGNVDYPASNGSVPANNPQGASNKTTPGPGG